MKPEMPTVLRFCYSFLSFLVNFTKTLNNDYVEIVSIMHLSTNFVKVINEANNAEVRL